MLCFSNLLSGSGHIQFVDLRAGQVYQLRIPDLDSRDRNFYGLVVSRYDSGIHAVQGHCHARTASKGESPDSGHSGDPGCLVSKRVKNIGFPIELCSAPCN